ncbi:MAG: 16S rRNA (guanine(966)-N(2))-methyltransferase RsmD [Immundisolibacteraceae bacterium]|nr:16S rRNA (guanine(966)-N(2))-methyltransferase RsmD [Immundisolibacteraceae bacterium]
MVKAKTQSKGSRGKNSPVKKQPHGGSGSLRIIGGQWRGRRIPIVEVKNLKPTPDRVRETLFNWLQADINGSHCVDLFAGSGALAFEALSRGAASVIAVDSSHDACDQMRQSAAELGTDRLQVICADVDHFLNLPIKADQPDWQILFVDPPYDLGCPPPQWPAIIDHPKLSIEALIYLESHARDQHNAIENTDNHWAQIRNKVAGEVCYRLLQRQQ